MLLAVLAVLGLAGLITITRGQMLASVLFARNYFPIGDDAGWYTGHLWSLAVEEHFYLLWPGLLVLWSPSRARPRVLLLALAVAAWRVVEFRLRLLEHVIPGVSFFLRTDIRLDALLWGCWMALVLRDPAWRERAARLLRGPRWVAALVLLIVVMVFSPPLALLWQSVLVPMVLVGTTLNPGGIAGRLLELGPLRWVGRISYSLYLWQQLFMVPVFAMGQLGLSQSLPWSIAATFAAATLSYHLIERPMIRLGHRLAPPTTEGRV
jgi:peptidoglycan/LPS O-acetylase OafA/YrhL